MVFVTVYIKKDRKCVVDFTRSHSFLWSAIVIVHKSLNSRSSLSVKILTLPVSKQEGGVSPGFAEEPMKLPPRAPKRVWH